MFREQQERFENWKSTSETTHEQLIRVCEISNQVHHTQQIILFWTQLHTTPFIVRRKHANKLLIWDSMNFVRRVGKYTVIYVKVNSVSIA